MDEIYVRTRSIWKYVYHAVGEAGAAVDFLLTAKRDRKAALLFLRKAIGQNAIPKKITIAKSAANKAMIECYKMDHEAGFEIDRRKISAMLLNKITALLKDWQERC